MKSVTIRELRQNWPGIERRLKRSRDPLIVTRDGTPVAQLSPAPAPIEPSRPGFSATAHRQWRVQQGISSKLKIDSSQWLARTREELLRSAK